MLTTIFRRGKQAGWHISAETLQIKADVKEDKKGQIVILASPDMNYKLHFLSMMVKFAL